MRHPKTGYFCKEVPRSVKNKRRSRRLYNELLEGINDIRRYHNGEIPLMTTIYEVYELSSDGLKMISKGYRYHNETVEKQDA